MRISDWSSDVCSSDLPPSQTVEANGSIQQTVEEVQSSADRIRQAMEVQAQTVTMITAAVDETALAADSMSSTIAAIRADTDRVPTEIDEVESGFVRANDQTPRFHATPPDSATRFAARALYPGPPPSSPEHPPN